MVVSSRSAQHSFLLIEKIIGDQVHALVEAGISHLGNSGKGKTEIINEVLIRYIGGLCSVVNGGIYSPNLHRSIN